MDLATVPRAISSVAVFTVYSLASVVYDFDDSLTDLRMN